MSCDLKCHYTGLCSKVSSHTSRANAQLLLLFFYYILQITLQIIAIIVSVLPPFIQAIKWTYWSVHYLICTADDVLALLVWKIYIISVILLDGLCVTPPPSLTTSH